jgi:hypothetical protein
MPLQLQIAMGAPFQMADQTWAEFAEFAATNAPMPIEAWLTRCPLSI